MTHNCISYDSKLIFCIDSISVSHLALECLVYKQLMLLFKHTGVRLKATLLISNEKRIFKISEFDVSLLVNFFGMNQKLKWLYLRPHNTYARCVWYRLYRIVDI